MMPTPSIKELQTVDEDIGSSNQISFVSILSFIYLFSFLFLLFLLLFFAFKVMIDNADIVLDHCKRVYVVFPYLFLET